MPTITTSNDITRLMEDGIQAIFQQDYLAKKDENALFFDVEEEAKDTITQQGVESLSFAVEKEPGTQMASDKRSQTISPRYQMVTYALQAPITWEAMHENRYKSELKDTAEALSRSLFATSQLIGQNVFNNGFTAGVTMLGGDGQPLFSTAHPNGPNNAGSTYSNRLAIDAEFSESSLETLIIQIHNTTNNRNLATDIKPTLLFGPNDLQFEFQRVTNSVLTPSTNNNANNIIKEGRYIPNWAVGQYLSSSTAWFLRTDCPRGMTKYISKRAGVQRDSEWSYLVMNFLGWFREIHGWGDPRGCYGTTGA